MANPNWTKGKSGNPGGRPKSDINVRELARQYTEAALKTLSDLLIHSEDEKVRVMCATALLDRGHGKP